MLPKIWLDIRNGGVYRQSIRCGKHNCRCFRGHPHEAYYFIEREGGKQRKTYVPKSDVTRIRKLVDQHRLYRSSMQRMGKTGVQALQETIRAVRDLDSLFTSMRIGSSTTSD